jgi:hypothetical protein
MDQTRNIIAKMTIVQALFAGTISGPILGTEFNRAMIFLVTSAEARPDFRILRDSAGSALG